MSGLEIFEYNLTSPQSTDFNQQFFQDENNRFHCTFPGCNKVFRFKSEISRHTVIHYNNRPFVCHYKDCMKSFKRADALEAHIYLHQKNLPFECTVDGCTKRFATKATLKYHVLKHNDNRVFTCSFPGCDRTFFTKGQLKQHEKAATYHQNMEKLGGKREEPMSFPSSPSTNNSENQQDSLPCSPSYIPNIDWDMDWQFGGNFAQEIVMKTEDDKKESFDSFVKSLLIDNTAENQQGFVGDESNFFMEPVAMKGDCVDESEFTLYNFLKEQQFLSF